MALLPSHRGLKGLAQYLAKVCGKPVLYPSGNPKKLINSFNAILPTRILRLMLGSSGDACPKLIIEGTVVLLVFSICSMSARFLVLLYGA